jgi:hypothetical protein
MKTPTLNPWRLGVLATRRLGVLATRRLGVLASKTNPKIDACLRCDGPAPIYPFSGKVQRVEPRATNARHNPHVILAFRRYIEDIPRAANTTPSGSLFAHLNIAQRSRVFCARTGLPVQHPAALRIGKTVDGKAGGLGYRVERAARDSSSGVSSFARASWFAGCSDRDAGGASRSNSRRSAAA